MTPEDELRIDDYCRIAQRPKLTAVFILLETEPKEALRILKILWQVEDSEREYSPTSEDCV